MSLNAIGSEQLDVINKNVNFISESSDFKDLERNISRLNSDCVICYCVLEHLAQNNLECAKRLEQWKINNTNKVLVQQNQNLQNEMSKTRQAVWLSSGNNTVSNTAWFIVFMKWLIVILFAPLFMLPWALTDPYKHDFCFNHLASRPIKKERLRRFAIYGVVSLIWFFTVGMTFWFK